MIVIQNEKLKMLRGGRTKALSQFAILYDDGMP